MHMACIHSQAGWWVEASTFAELPRHRSIMNSIEAASMDPQEQYSAVGLRLWLVSTQYRQPVNYTQRALEEASERAFYVYQAVRRFYGCDAKRVACTVLTYLLCRPQPVQGSLTDGQSSDGHMHHHEGLDNIAT